MTSKELYVKGARVWIPSNSELVWEGGVLESDYKVGDTSVKVVTINGKNVEIKINNEKDLPYLRNPTVLIGQNDLTGLSYLHEPDVLHNLEVRFKESQVIYTYCGIVLVAINPYQDLPIYGSDIIRTYRGHSMGELEPHIFAVSEEAYAKLEREKSNISIIVSGESGAGKTVSAKYSMRYFAHVGGSESETQIERKVLASSPIMEAIGNAKTTRNDNSSRFGKFTKLLFNNDISTMSLTGASMQTYLLEKSRVVFQANGERNYHIFYQLCSSREKYPELMLHHQDYFRFLNQGKSPNIAKISDANDFNETLNALSILDFSSDKILAIFRVLAGILHLGNINIAEDEEGDQDTCSISSDDHSLNTCSDILHLNKQELRQWLMTRQIESFNESVNIPMNKSAAEATRDALAKHLYSKLFHFIVKTININLIGGKSNSKSDGFIAVLDIYGFETFDVNSFEQFSINYANEKLQQQFNQHVFKLEQEEYLKEGIHWTMIDFYDNQPCIDLIEAKLGILDLLDEECRMPNGSDASWISKLNEKCSKYKHFDKPRFGTSSFLIKHFSDAVQYEARGFVEKNRDTVSKKLENVIEQSDMEFCRQLILLDEKNYSVGNNHEESAHKSNLTKVVFNDSKTQTLPSKQQKQTVGSQFRESLSQLISTLHSTTPHYVRCIKPNEEKKPFKWEPEKIVQQLRACGVLETVRISAAGFPSRWTYDAFYERYRLLCKRGEIVDWNVKATCTNIMRNLLKDEDKYRFGNTQIFFRAGQVAYFEQLRTELRRKHIIKLQSVIRRFIYRKKFLRLKRVAIGLQSRARGMLARRKANIIRQNRAAIQIQRYIKGWFYRNRFVKLKRSVLAMQRYGRGFIARQSFANSLNNFKATEIQRFCRGYLARRQYKMKIQNIVKAQAVVRAFLARRTFKKLKAEARTISHLQTKYKGLENKIIELQQKCDIVNKENSSLKAQISLIPSLKSKVETLKSTENEFKMLKVSLSEKERLLISVQKSLDIERDEKMAIIEEKNRAEEEWLIERNLWAVEKQKLKQNLNEMNEEAILAKTSALSEVKTNEINLVYQKVLKEKESFEKENVLLKQEIKRLQMIITNPRESDNLKNNVFSHDEDFGYSSSRNTLEKRHKAVSSITSSQLSEDQVTSTPNNSPVHDTTVLMLRLRKLLEEEKDKGDYLRSEVNWLKRKSNMSGNTEDSIKISELEVENEKWRQDYQLLRNSIQRGVEQQELEAQYASVVEESRRRRDECIQLKSILSQQLQMVRAIDESSDPEKRLRGFEENELMVALQAQKLANKQLESELTALTEEHNMRLTKMTVEMDLLRSEKKRLESIVQEKLEKHGVDDKMVDVETLIQKESYLRLEIEKSAAAYVSSQENLNEARKQIKELEKKNSILFNRLKENGLNDSVLSSNSYTSDETADVSRKTDRCYQGILKHKHSDEGKILQRIVTDLTPRTAIGLAPGLPAYILFMCIRYTDLLNADNQVKTLLTNFILTVKKFYKIPHKVETRILWIVNTITLHNLLKQFGGNEDYMQFNTESQNQQQLKNFDLSEYCQVIHEAIICMYETLVRQIQEIIKPLIVPAILCHDEITRARNKRALSTESPKSAGPQSLVDQLEQIYKQFEFYGLHNCYREQIFQQLFYFVCAVALNNLMLRRDLCTWKTGVNLRHNVGCLESWITKEKKMSKTVCTPSTSLTEAAQLLQSRKSDNDINNICEICPSLTPSQILKLIKSYTPDDCEGSISTAFIEKLTKHLGAPENETFTMNENDLRPLTVLFNYTELKLEDIEVPEVLKLNNLVTRI